MYNYESKYKTDKKVTIEYVAQYGTCDFICWHCEINKECEEHNHQREAELNQIDFRKKAAKEYLMGGKV